MLCDNLEERAGRGIQERGTYACLWPIHVNVWQRPAQDYKTIILPLKKEKRLLEKSFSTTCHLESLPVCQAFQHNTLMSLHCNYPEMHIVFN